MAGSIKLFSFNRKYYHLYGIYPPQSNHGDQKSINLRNWIFIISLVLLALQSGAFFMVEAKFMLEYGMSFFGTSLSVFWLCIYLEMVWQMKSTWTFIENCERFIEKREDSIAAYRETIEKIERLCEFIGIVVIITILSVTLPFLIYTLISYYILDMGEESFVLLFPVSCPFNWKTPLGYFVAWSCQFAGATAMATAGIIFFNFIFGSCWLFIVMAEDITKDVAAFNSDVNANKNCVEWMKRFCDIVQLYSDAKEHINEFHAIVKYSLFTLIFFLMLSVTSTLLNLQFQLMDENAKFFEKIVVFLMIVWIFGTLFLICEFGERVSYEFDLFREELERSDWTALPIKTQRMYLIFLSDTQQPKNIKCYGNVLLTRETFKQTVNTGWSYFLTLRQFEV